MLADKDAHVQLFEICGINGKDKAWSAIVAVRDVAKFRDETLRLYSTIAPLRLSA